MFLKPSCCMNHLSRIREAHSIATSICYNNGARSFVCFMASPVPLEFQKNLYPASQVCTGLLQSSQGEFVTLRGQAAAGVCNDEHLEAIFKRRKTRKGDASLGEESGDNQPPSLRSKDCIPRGLILPNVHGSSFDCLYRRKHFLQLGKERTAVDSRCRSRCDDRNFKGDGGPRQGNCIIEQDLPWRGLDAEPQSSLKIDEQHHAFLGLH